VAGILGYARNSSRIRGSTSSTIDPAGARTYLGAASDASAVRTVFLETPITRATCEIDNPSDRRNRRISAQSSTFSTYFLPDSTRARLSAQVVNFRVPRPVQFSGAADRADHQPVPRFRDGTSSLLNQREVQRACLETRRLRKAR
jgi:hypothetical protein